MYPIYLTNLSRVTERNVIPGLGERSLRSRNGRDDGNLLCFDVSWHIVPAFFDSPVGS